MPIKVKPDKDGRVFVNLYGQEIEITDFDKEGRAVLNRFGETYEFVLDQPKPKKKAKKEDIESEE